MLKLSDWRSQTLREEPEGSGDPGDGDRSVPNAMFGECAPRLPDSAFTLLLLIGPYCTFK